jgi:signal transduction histidine kinase/CheY-like chemotaxis protein
VKTRRSRSSGKCVDSSSLEKSSGSVRVLVRLISKGRVVLLPGAASTELVQNLAVRHSHDPRTEVTVIEEVNATRIDTGMDVVLRVTAAPIQQENRVVGAVLMTADMTEQRRLEKKLFDKQRLESIGLLAGGVAHDFNNLLCAIMGNASLLQSRAREGDMNQTQLQAVLEAATRAGDLTRQLLAYAGKGKFVIEPVDVSALVGNITSLLRTSISRVINLELDLEKGHAYIEADPGQIQQVVMNLVINAAEAIGAGQCGTVRVATRVEELDERQTPATDLSPGQYVLLEVSDTGCGMDDQTRLKIFDPFFTTKSAGRGLGLSVVSGIVRSHKGALLVNSSPGQGTSFRIWLPVAQNVSPSASVDEPQVHYRGTGTILVVDDEEMLRSMTKAMLEDAGYTVLLAENGPVALDTFARDFESISLVLLDLTMPVMTGQETLIRLKAICSGVPVIVSSGYSGEDILEEVKTQGAAAFIHKPYTVSQLTGMIRDTLKMPTSLSVSALGMSAVRRTA